MTVIVYASVLAAALAFLAASAARAVRYARTPPHLRWELYPVPHEDPHRARYGGSYLEVSEWWRAPRRVSLAGELRVMIPEMLFLESLRRSNRSLWLRSFPFHFGLYLLAGAIGLLLFDALIVVGVGGLEVGGRFETVAVGAALVGVILSAGGAAALLARRLLDPSVRLYSTLADVLNLVWFIAAFVLLAGGYLARPASSPGALAIAAGILSWDTGLVIPTPLAAGLLACAALVAYIPLTHMSHFVAKFFTYHAVRWDDRPLIDDRRMADRLATCTAYRPTWSAGHIRTADARTWSQVAASNPARDER